MRFTRSRVSYIPSATDCACVQPRVVCSPSQADAGPWQFSQLTPSFNSKVLARCSGGTSARGKPGTSALRRIANVEDLSHALVPPRQ